MIEQEDAESAEEYPGLSNLSRTEARGHGGSEVGSEVG